LTEKLIHCH